MSQIPSNAQVPGPTDSPNSEASTASAMLDDMLNASFGESGEGNQGTEPQQGQAKEGDKGGEANTPPSEMSADDQVKTRVKLAKAGYSSEFIEEAIKDNPKLAKSLALQEEARQQRETRAGKKSKESEEAEVEPGDGSEDDANDDGHEEGATPRQQKPEKGGKDRVKAVEAMLDDPEVSKEFETFLETTDADGRKSFKRGLARVLAKLGIGDETREAVNRLRSEVRATQQQSRNLVLDAVRRDLTGEFPSLATEAKWRKVEGHVKALQETPAYRDIPVRDLVRKAALWELGDESRLVEQQKREAMKRDRRGGSSTLAGTEAQPQKGARSVEKGLDAAMDAAIAGKSQADVDAAYRSSAPA